MFFHHHHFKKKISILFILTILLLSGFIAVWFANNSTENKEYPYLSPRNFPEELFSSDIDDPIAGTGIDQIIRVYMKNQSSSLNNNDYFNISAPSTSSYLTYGDFNFTLENNYTTDYKIENDDALDLEKYRNFEFNPDKSNVSEPENSLDIGDFTDNDLGTYYPIVSDAGGGTPKIINITLNANYTNQNFQSLIFNRSKILGFQYNLSLIIGDVGGPPDDVKISIFMNNLVSGWINLTTNIIEATSSMQFITGTITNEKFDFINLSNIIDIRFIFERKASNDYYIELYELDYNAIQGYELQITNTNEFALEFDLKGKSSTINGIYAWIRTLNTTKANDAKLTISLYYANGTIPRTQSDLSSKSIIPDSSNLITQQDFPAYKEDKLYYFDLPDSSNLLLYNYFVVIKSNISDPIYNLVCIPQQTGNNYGDKEIDQILLNGTIATDTWTYQNFDASSFKINVTRGYMPSDFETDSFINLTIDNIPFENRIIQNQNKSDEEWGLGQWKNSFSNYIKSNGTPEFQVDLNWDTSITSGFEFNVTPYIAVAYHAVNVSSYYEMDYDSPPEWTINYTFNSSDIIFTNWNFTQFWFTYDDYNTAVDLIDPNFDSVFSQTGGEKEISDTPTLDKVVVSNDTINITDGIYSLKLESFNAISNIFSYIDYYGNSLESYGFMHGDNMTIRADIRGPGSIAPTNGQVNATLFYPNGTTYKTDNDDIGTRTADKAILYYTFGDRILLEIDNTIPVYGKYYLGMVWGNGTLIGAKKVPIYIDYYNISFGNFSYLPEINQNLLEVKRVEKIGENDKISPYNLHIASVNQTTQFPSNFYSFNISEINQKFYYEISGYQLKINVKSFLQNESIINPNEKVKFKIILENLDPLFEIDLKVSIKLVSSINEDWIISNDTSSIQTLDQKGSGNNIKEFDLTLDVPGLTGDGYWEGLTAPIRQGGAKAIATIYLEDEILGTYECPNVALLVNKTSEELEGYILSVKSSFTQAPALLNLFKRDKCLYPPEKTTFIANIIDENYISTYQVINTSYELKIVSNFQNIKINPQNPINGSKFNLTATLKTEFGEVLKDKNVTCQYFNGTAWVNITSPLDKTDKNGVVSFQIDTENLTLPSLTLQLKLIWDGNITILNTSKIIEVNLFEHTNQFLIYAQFINTEVYQGEEAYLRIFIQNQGTSSIKIKNILFLVQISIKYYSYEQLYFPSYKIIQQEAFKLQSLSPGESTIFDLAIDFQNPPTNPLILNLRVEAQNLDTLKSFSAQQLISVRFLSQDVSKLFIENFMIFMIILLALIWIIAVIYSYRLKKKIETPKEPKKEKKEKLVKGEYVKVSKLPKKGKEKRDKTTDLDSLLEKEGLKD